jgi:hypothetical protein
MGMIVFIIILFYYFILFLLLSSHFMIFLGFIILFQIFGTDRYLPRQILFGKSTTTSELSNNFYEIFMRDLSKEALSKDVNCDIHKNLKKLPIIVPRFSKFQV